MEAELPIGSTTAGVVRVGDTVRRPYGPWVPTIQSLLLHLEAHRFPAPRPLGLDDGGREVLSWVPGASTWDDHARYWSSNDMLVRAARLVRRLHDVLDLWVPPDDAVWRGGWGRPDDGEAHPIVHHDLAPYNVVIDDAGALAVIDWDGAGPGDRTAELSYAIDGFCLLRRDDFCTGLGWSTPPRRAERIDIFANAYGVRENERGSVADAIVANARSRMAFGIAMHEQNREPWASWWREDEGAGDREDLAVTERAVAEWLG